MATRPGSSVYVMPKTICHVVNYGGPISRTFTVALDSLAEKIHERGDRFVLFAPRLRSDTIAEYLGFTRGLLREFDTNDELVAHLRELQPNIVHTHFARFDFAALRGAPRSRIFWHAHSHRDNYSLYDRAKSFARYRIIGSRVEAIVAVSQFIREQCIEFFAPPNRVHVVYNGIDSSHFRPPTKSERAAARQKYALGASERVVLFFERVPYKGGATLQRALTLMPGTRLIVVGGLKEDRDRLGADAISIERVADPRELYWAADVLAFPSLREAFGLVVAEALACAVPIAASDIAAVREICGNVDSVVLFPAGDSQGLAAAIHTALTESFTSIGRQRAVSEFSLQKWTSRILQLYDKR